MNDGIRYWRDKLHRYHNHGGRKPRKPRTNCEAIEFWAAHALVEGKVIANTGDTNSIVISRDVVYSFGSHYPMGRICRNVDGACIEIVVNADYYPCKGFASTPNDQGDVERAAHAVAAMSRGRIKVRKVYLSEYNLPNGIQILPRADDPKPTDSLDWQVPRRFSAYNPGPEPVDTNGHLCVAGRVEEYSYQDDKMLVLPGDFERARGFIVRKGRWHYERRAYNGTIVWGSESYEYGHGPNVTYNQCPHCKEFQLRHRIWKVLMHGGHHPQTFSRVRGWDEYQANLHKHGGWEGWLIAYRAERTRVRDARKAMEEWIDRNYMPLSACSTDGHGVPALHDDKYAMRKDAERWFKAKRQRKREDMRREREHRRRERERQQVERFKSRVRHRRAQLHARTFEGTAQRVVEDLAAIRESYHTAIPELQTDNNSPGG